MIYSLLNKNTKDPGEDNVYCSNCGTKQSEGASFCHACGHQVVGKSTAKFETETREIHNHEQQPGHRLSAETKSTQVPLLTESDTKEKYLRHYVGAKKVDYYFIKWRKGKISWNWAAFFLNIFWLGYRKMYGMVLTILGTYIAIILLTVLLDLGELLNAGIGLGIAVFLGMYGNQLYKDHALKQVKKLQEQHGERAGVYLARYGGPSWDGFWISFASFIGYVILTSVILMVPAMSGIGLEESASNPDINEAFSETTEETEEGTSPDTYEGETIASDEELENLYQTNCAACHGQNLEGIVGPELNNIGSKYSKEDLVDIMMNGKGSMPAVFVVYEGDAELIAEWLLARE